MTKFRLNDDADVDGGAPIPSSSAKTRYHREKYCTSNNKHTTSRNRIGSKMSNTATAATGNESIIIGDHSFSSIFNTVEDVGDNNDCSFMTIESCDDIEGAASNAAGVLVNHAHARCRRSTVTSSTRSVSSVSCSNHLLDLSVSSSFDSDDGEDKITKSNHVPRPNNKRGSSSSSSSLSFPGQQYFRLYCIALVGCVLVMHMVAMNQLFTVSIPNRTPIDVNSSSISSSGRSVTINNLMQPPTSTNTSRSAAVEEMNYVQYWDRAKAEALASTQKESNDVPSESLPCPKVFVYNLSKTFHDSKHTHSRRSVFGPESIEGFHGKLRETNQHHVGVIFEHRLSLPNNCYATDDPNEADLFFAPVLLSRKKAPKWASTCKSLNVTALLDELVHLTPETSRKHFFVFPKGHYSAENCKGWFFDPHPLLNESMRLAYSHVPGTADDPELMYFTKASPDPARDALRHPNLVSVPYPSSVHWMNFTHDSYIKRNKGIMKKLYWKLHDTAQNAVGTMKDALMGVTFESKLESMYKMPWSDHSPEQRPHLMSFVGRFDHGDVPVRRMIQQQCEKYDDSSICHLPSHEVERRSSLPSDSLLIKGKSIFCLEPAGDSPWRKGLSDSITFGCIPVLFSQLSDDITPWHWGEWKSRGRVLVDREAFVSGKVDLYKLLNTIPHDLLEVMQSTISANARKYQYSLNDDPYDGFHLTMTKLKESSQQRSL
mmetsp:Transcript_46476/g.113192  ORF Transcript_46476/g.113192 Transcript_46476/m.113192 type:complete len:714 (-) Transcript_46476:1547-3688(-)